MNRSLIPLLAFASSTLIAFDLSAQQLLHRLSDEGLSTAAGEYRTVRSGLWSNDSTWSRFVAGVWITPATPPDSSCGVITVGSGHTVTIKNTLVYDQVVVEEGGEVIVAAGVSHTLSDGPGSDLTINGTWLNQGGTWTVLGSARWVVNDGGTFVQNTNAGISTPLSKGTLSPASNFVYRGSSVLSPSSSFSGRTFGNLILESSAGSWVCTASGGSSLVIEGSLTIGPGVKWNTGAFSGTIGVKGGTLINGEWNGSGTGNLGTHTFAGDFTIGSAGKYQLSTSGPSQGSIVFQGNLSIGGMIVTPSNRPIVFNGSGPQSISDATGLTFSNGFTSSNILTIASGTNVIAGPGTTLRVNSDLVVHGLLSAVDASGVLAVRGAGSRIILDGATLSVGRIVISDGQDHTLMGTGILAGCSIVVDSSSSLVCDCNLTLKDGALSTLNGSLTLALGSTVTYNGTSIQTISPLSYSNLVVKNASGTILCGPTSVNGNLSVPSGSIDTREYNLTLGPSALSLEAGAPSVVGTIVTTRTLEGEIAMDFGALGLELTSSTPMRGTVTLTRVTGKTPSIRAKTSLLKYFDILYSGSGLDANLVFYYQLAELRGIQETSLQLFSSTDTGATWSNRGGLVDVLKHTITVRGVNSSSRWAAGEALPPPSLRTVSPASAEAGKALDIILDGGDFTTGEARLSFSGNGITVDSISALSSTQIKAHIVIGPMAVLGSRDVCVTTDGGTAVLTAGFVITAPANPVPTLLRISPTFGARSQSVTVTLDGSNFMSGQSVVSFGDGVEVVSLRGNATTLTACIAIADEAGTGDRIVTLMNPPPGGGLSILPYRFSIINPIPAIESATPNAGICGEKVCVVLKGSGFLPGVTATDFGPGILVDSLVIMSATMLRVTITILPTASTGPRDIMVLNLGPGGGPATLVGGFRVANPAPRIFSVAPSSGMRGKPVMITVSGKDFIPGSTKISLGTGMSIDSILCVSGSELTAKINVARNAVTGWTHLTVFNEGPGGGSSTLPDAFEVLNPPPTAKGIYPMSCCLGEKLMISLTGADFLEGVSRVDFGPGISVDSMRYDSTGTRILLKINISREIAAGVRDVVVSNYGPGGGSAVLPASFAIEIPFPSIAAVNPAGGGKGETLGVLIRGTNFIAGMTAVKFGPGIAVNAVTFESSTDIKVVVCVASDAVIGARSVVVTNPQPGGGSAQLPHVFNVEYLKPEITRVSPATGCKGDRIIVLAEGANFVHDVTKIDFGDGIIVDSVQTEGPGNLCACVTIGADASLGPRDIVVWNPPPGGGSVRLSQAFVVQDPAPMITRLFPVSARRGERVIVTVEGANFLAELTEVNFGSDILVDSVKVRSSTTLQAFITIATSATIGPRTITVQNTRATGASASLLNGFSVSSDATTHVWNDPNLIPDRLVLEEAFPNPFNPSTTIRFGLPERCRVMMEVYTLLGTTVAQLVDAEQSEGYHEIRWTACDLSSGVYIVRLRSESLETQKHFVECKRIVLLR